MVQGEKINLIVRVSVPAEIEDEFNEWYDTEHIPNLLKVPGVLSAKRGVLYEGDGPKYIAIYEHLNAQVAQSSAYKDAVETKWTKRMRQHFKSIEVQRFYIV